MEAEEEELAPSWRVEMTLAQDDGSRAWSGAETRAPPGAFSGMERGGVEMQVRGVWSDAVGRAPVRAADMVEVPGG